MSRSDQRSGRRRPSGRSDRYLQPSLLLALKRRAAYGYELIQKIAEFGFVEGQAPPGMIYRHLRELEANGLVVSEWMTEDSGPAKRIYRLTHEGGEALALWIGFMRAQAERLLNFVEQYRALSGT